MAYSKNLKQRDKALHIADVSGSIKDEYRKCATCGKEMNMTKGEYKTTMHQQMHRYVCSINCMVAYYR